MQFKYTSLYKIVFIAFVLHSISALAETTPLNEQIFARINQRVISNAEFVQIFHQAVRFKYYHGEVPKQELVRFKRQVAKDIIDQVLVYQEAINLGLKPETKKIQSGLATYNQKYQANLIWQNQKKQNLPLLMQRLERQNLIEQMVVKIKNITPNDTAALKIYYQQHPEKFTEPKRLWLSVILLAVAPSSTEKTWLDAKTAAQQFIKRIKQGDSFEKIARKYSSHLSAVKGGDLGYLHQGLLDGEARRNVEKLKLHDISEPIRVLEGITIFRVNGVQEIQLKSFESVKDRVSSLLNRELQNEAWNEYLKKLKQSADIYVNEKIYAEINEQQLIK